MSGNFKLALLQMHVEGGNRTCYLNHAEELIAQAATKESHWQLSRDQAVK